MKIAVFVLNTKQTVVYNVGNSDPTSGQAHSAIP